ncbi:MAG: dicarboxylate/amino acid:cation symporter, partial [Candidatus Binatia bacterium]
MPLHLRILLGLFVGVVGGVLSRVLVGDHPLLLDFVTYVAEPFGRLFLRLIFMVVLPLLFSALALGVAGLGDMATLGRIGLKTLLYTLIVTSISVFLGLTLVNLFRPGDGLSPEIRAALQQTAPTPVVPTDKTNDNPVLRTLIAIVPDNPLRAAAQGEV